MRKSVDMDVGMMECEGWKCMKMIMLFFIAFVAWSDATAITGNTDGFGWTTVGNGSNIGNAGWAKITSVPPRSQISMPYAVYHNDAYFVVDEIGSGAFNNAKAIVQQVSMPLGLTTIGGYAFKDCCKLLTVSDSEVSSIGVGAFKGCVSLESFSIPSNVTSVADELFFGCENLRSLNVPRAHARRVYEGVYVAAGVSSVGARSFWGCKMLEELDLATSESIGERALWGCGKLKTLVISDAIKSIGECAFAGCGQLTTAMYIPKCVKTIGGGLFGFCTNLVGVTIDPDNPNYVEKSGVIYDKAQTRVVASFPVIETAVLPSSNTTIDRYAFYGCCKLQSLTTQSTLTEIAVGAFEGCQSLNEFVWPANIEVIPESVFNGCLAFRNFDIPEGVRRINALAFANCGSLRRISIPKSVEYVDTSAFSNCNAVVEVTLGRCDRCVKKVLPSLCAQIEILGLDDDISVLPVGYFEGCENLKVVKLPETIKDLGDTNLKSVIQGWKDFAEDGYWIQSGWLLGCTNNAAMELVIPDGVIGIAPFALSDMYDLERVELPETVRYIGKGAFANDTYLDEVVLPDSVEVIGEGAFENCSWMQTMAMGAGVRSVGGRAFAGCTKLAAAKFADGLGEVGDAAFSNCWRMMSVSLPVSVSNVAATAFKDCASLTGVTVPTMIAPMSEWFAPVYRQIENVTVPEGTTEVCAEMFAGCAALKTVELPEGVTNIANGAFRDCVALETILLPESVEAVGDEAFAGCAALKAIVLPKNVAVLGKRVFSGCAALSDVTLSRALTAIPDGTFAGCDALDSFVVPESVTELGSQIVPSATTAIYYLGNAPAYAADVYAQANAALVSYVVDGTKGWDGRPTSRDIPQTWPMTNARTIRTWSPPPPSVTVRFNATGGTVEPEERVYVSEAPFGELPMPVRTHYDFVGWFTEASGGTQETAASEVPLADRELFAHWTAKQYAIRFHANDGTERTTDQAFTYGATVTLAKNGFTRTGYAFSGWYVSAPRSEDAAGTVGDGATLEDLSAIQDGVIHLYAVWTANGYEVRFDANGGEGTMEPQGFVYDEAKALRANAFVRDGYEFVEWNVSAPRREDASGTVEDGAVVSNMTTVAGGVVTLFAQWEEIAGPPPVKPPVEPPVEPIELPEEPVVEPVVTNTITYVGLEGAANTNVTEFTTNDLPLVLGPVEREGWRFLGWTPNGGVIPVGTVTNVTFKASWEKNDRSQTVVGESEAHVDVEKGEKAPYEDAAAVYDGCLYDGGKIVGSVQVKVAKMKSGVAKVTATVQLAGEAKKLSFKGGNADQSGNVSEMTDKNNHKLAVTVGVKGLGGTFDGKYKIDGARNVFSGKSDADKLAAEKAMLDCMATYNVAFDGGTLSVSVDKKGKAKIAGTVEGNKVSATSQLVVGDGAAVVPVVIVKKANVAFGLWVMAGGTVEVRGVDSVTSGEDAASPLWVAGKAGTLKAGEKFWMDEAAVGKMKGWLTGLYTDYLPKGVAVDQNGKKWIVAGGAKAGKVAFAKGTTTIDTSKLGENPSGLKLSYKEKGGTFTGSFKAYNLENGKIKSYTASVTGVMIGDTGYGTATIKKLGTVAVTISKDAPVEDVLDAPTEEPAQPAEEPGGDSNCKFRLKFSCLV